jgi:hypothetical protein
MNPIQQHIEESGKQIDLAIPSIAELFETKGLVGTKEYIKSISISQQLALVEKIKEMIEGKKYTIIPDDKIQLRNFNYFNKILDDILQDLTIKK